MREPDPHAGKANHTGAVAGPSRAPSAMRPAWCSGMAVGRFVLILAALLAADLAFKAWAFENVATYPVRIVSDRQAMIDSPPAQVTGEQVVLFGEPGTIEQSMQGVVVVPGALHLKLTMNTGAVFGLGSGGRWLFIAVSVVAVGVIGYLFARSPAGAWGMHLSLVLILAGAMGNLYDRIRFGAVRDMLYMLPGTGLWPWIFNLADVFLLTGVGLVLMLSFRQERRASRASTPDPSREGA